MVSISVAANGQDPGFAFVGLGGEKVFEVVGRAFGEVGQHIHLVISLMFSFWSQRG